jgi:hypothetical protein
MAAPGRYSVALFGEVDGELTPLSEPQSFDVVPLREGALAGAAPAEVAAFWRQYEQAVRQHTALRVTLSGLVTQARRVTEVLRQSTADLGPLDRRTHELRREILDLDDRLNGNRSRKQPGEKAPPTVGDRLASVSRGVGGSTYGPTGTHRASLEIANRELAELRTAIEAAQGRMNALVQDLVAAGAPWLEGVPLPGEDG